MKLTLAHLANLQQHAWEVQRELGLHMRTPMAFQQHIMSMSAAELRNTMESLGLLFRTIEEIGTSEIELVANGEHSLFAPLCQTKTAQVTGADENIVCVPPVDSPQPAKA